VDEEPETLVGAAAARHLNTFFKGHHHYHHGYYGKKWFDFFKYYKYKKHDKDDDDDDDDCEDKCYCYYKKDKHYKHYSKYYKVRTWSLKVLAGGATHDSAWMALPAWRQCSEQMVWLLDVAIHMSSIAVPAAPAVAPPCCATRLGLNLIP
jgi:hypothetical protein